MARIAVGLLVVACLVGCCSHVHDISAQELDDYAIDLSTRPGEIAGTYENEGQVIAGEGPRYIGSHLPLAWLLELDEVGGTSQATWVRLSTTGRGAMEALWLEWSEARGTEARFHMADPKPHALGGITWSQTRAEGPQPEGSHFFRITQSVWFGRGADGSLLVRHSACGFGVWLFIVYPIHYVTWARFEPVDDASD